MRGRAGPGRRREGAGAGPGEPVARGAEESPGLEPWRPPQQQSARRGAGGRYVSPQLAGPVASSRGAGRPGAGSPPHAWRGDGAPSSRGAGGPGAGSPPHPGPGRLLPRCRGTGGPGTGDRGPGRLLTRGRGPGVALTADLHPPGPSACGRPGLGCSRGPSGRPASLFASAAAEVGPAAVPRASSASVGHVACCHSPRPRGPRCRAGSSPSSGACGGNPPAPVGAPRGSGATLGTGCPGAGSCVPLGHVPAEVPCARGA